MPDRLEQVKDILTRDNEEYRRLRERHHGFEERLEALNAKAFLTEQEKLESARLKKEKLHIKDRMAAIAREYLENASGLTGARDT
jgi:hypothetical protein